MNQLITPQRLIKEKAGKIIVNRGLCSERSVANFIKNHRIEVNGILITTTTEPVDIENDTILIDGNPVPNQKHFYIMMNKPEGVVCSTVSDRHKTVYELLPENLKNDNGIGTLHTIGRLDSDTCGLLLFTTNGSFSHFLTNPENNIPKTYYVKLEKKLSEQQQHNYVNQGLMGITVDAEKKSGAFKTRPAIIEWLSSDECNITVTEGKFHEVRRIFTKLENNVILLKRIKFGDIILDEALAPGDYKILDRNNLFNLENVHAGNCSGGNK